MLVSNLSLAPLQSASLCICACILPSSICLFSFSLVCLFYSFALYVYLIVLPYVCLSVCLSISIKFMPLWRIIFFKITYDLVTSSFTLLDLSSETERLVVIDNLWKKTNQVCQVKLSSSSCHWCIYFQQSIFYFYSCLHFHRKTWHYLNSSWMMKYRKVA